MGALEQLQSLFRELFQYDCADLDFGIYRLLRLKRDDVEAFLTEQLPRRVDEAFRGAAGEERGKLESELAELAARIRKDVSDDAILADGAIAAEYHDVPVRAARQLIDRYEAARESLRAIQVSEEQRAEVFNHLYAFFSRYYEAGDFIPKRRYGTREAYAVPYNGEEVLFHWANKDQHYVKTAEAFRDYAFTVDGLGGQYRVRFVLTAASVPPGNVKGDTRYFFPVTSEVEYDQASRTLRIPFHYRLPSEKEIETLGKNSKLQEALLQATLPKLLKAVPDDGLHAKLAEVVEQREDESVSYLLKRLRHFCRRNTTDYFIHKDLAGFLTRELEFYLKDQVLHLADLEADLASKQRTLRVIRQLAGEIITFLAQIEEVQKRLFEKKKFVLRIDYLVPIKNVPRELWKEVLANAAQLDDWKRLFAIEPKKDLFNKHGKVNEHFLSEHPTLVVNTAHFDADFTEQLLLAFDDLDDATDGLLIHSENYQALQLMQRNYAARIDCIYIDPPFNTGTDEFVYKDRYQHGSWLSMIGGRLAPAAALLSANGLFTCSLDDVESANLVQLLNALPRWRHLGEFVWRTRNTDNRVKSRLSVDHEYIHVYATGTSHLAGRLIDRSDFTNPDNDPRGPYTTDPLTGKANAKERPNLHFVVVNPETGDRYPPDPDFGWITDPKGFRDLIDAKLVAWPANPKTGKPRKKRFLSEMGERAPISSLGISIKQGEGNQDLSSLFGTKLLNFPKPVSVMKTVVDACSEAGSRVLDFFAGSGTTGQAVIELNRCTSRAPRRFVLVEAADYFDRILCPRVQKVIFAPEWEDAKPKRYCNAEEVARSPRLVKVLRVEGYEDALHNVATEKTLGRQATRANAQKMTVGNDVHRLSYLLRLPLEASATMLDLAALEHPFDYAIEVLTEDGPRVQSVDLAETFNWLYGLHAQRVETWRNPEDQRKYRVIKARNREDHRVLVLWRDMNNLDPVVERQFLEAKLNEEAPFDEVLINGDTATPGLRSLDVLFKRLMEEGET